MSIFEYIGVLVSVIMGLGITHLVTGMSKLIQHRSEVRLYMPHMLWTLNILIFILLIWWGMFNWSSHETWYAYEYLFIALYSIVMFFLASLLYPWDMASDVDVREHFFGNRMWFFGVLLVAWAIDVLATLVKADVGLRPVPTGYFGFIGVQILIATVGLLTSNRVVHAILPASFLIIVLSLVLFSGQNQISV